MKECVRKFLDMPKEGSEELIISLNRDRETHYKIILNTTHEEECGFVVKICKNVVHLRRK